MSKRVILDNKVFPSQARAAAYAGCDRSTMQRAIRRGKAHMGVPYAQVRTP